MNRLNHPTTRAGAAIPALLLLMIILASCGGDDTVAPADTNNAPPAPVIGTDAGGPADGATDVALAVVLHWACTDPDGDALTYAVRFGTAAPPAEVATGLTATSYAPEGLVHGTTYHWQVVASDGGKASSASPVWSFTTVAAAGETVSTPATPVGTTTGVTDVPLTFGSSGAVSSEGHAVEYRFDWGDGTMSDWAAGTSASHAWTAAGTYEVTARARCADDTDVMSNWSAARTVTVAEPAAEVVTRPDTPAGDTPVEPGVAASYGTGGSSSTLGHGLEYRFDWGDGTVSDWSILTSVSHSWAAAGAYDVTAQARCQDHPEVTSDRSLSLAVTVQGPETVSTPDPPAGPATTEIQTSQRYDVSGAASSWGHAVEYRIDWGDGQVGSWSAITYGSHAWTSAGAYDVVVQARCQDHPTVASDWSAPTTVTVTEPAETVMPPAVWNPPSSGGVDEPVEFTANGGVSNLYHALECRFDWGDGAFSDWVANTGGLHHATHAWAAAGAYEIRVQARCIEHPSAVSDWSAPASFEVLDTETVTAPLLSPGVDQTVDVGGYVNLLLYSAASSFGHALEYQVDWGDGTLTDWSIYNSVARIWDVEGDYTVRARARCQDHPDVMSDWNAGLVVHVVDLENVSTPTASGPSTGTVGVPYVVTATGAESSHGHALEYQLYWSWDYAQIGTGLGWTTIDNLTYTAESQGLKHLRVRARCIEHQIESSISNRLDVNFSP